MSSNVDNVSGLGLPQPSPEHGAVALPPYNESYDAQNATSVVAESAHMTPGVAPPLSPMVQGQATAGPLAGGLPQTAPIQSAASSVPADDDSDALDEEWVNKAKAIVEQTKTDPYIESKELGRAKADFLRIRYSKQIKVAEDKK